MTTKQANSVWESLLGREDLSEAEASLLTAVRQLLRDAEIDGGSGWSDGDGSNAGYSLSVRVGNQSPELLRAAGLEDDVIAAEKTWGLK